MKHQPLILNGMAIKWVTYTDIENEKLKSDINELLGYNPTALKHFHNEKEMRKSPMEMFVGRQKSNFQNIRLNRQMLTN